MFSICCVTSREHMFKMLCEYMSGSSFQRVTTLPCLVKIGLVQVEIESIYMSRDFTKERD